LVVITYDISDEKRLKRVAKLLESLGLRSQRSVFELDVGIREGKRIVKEIEKLIDPEIDKCFLYQINKKDDIEGTTSLERII